MDPLVEETMDAYGYCYNNPIVLTDPDGMKPKPGFWEGFFRSVGRGAVNLLRHAMNNPNHAGYDIGIKKAPSPESFKPYEINLKQQLDPYWQINNFSSNLVNGVSGFVGGIVNGDGEMTAKSIPNLLSAAGTISMFRGGMLLSMNGNRLNLALGKNINLKEFASKTGSVSMHNFNSIPGYNSASAGFKNFEDAFNFVTNASLSSNGKILFNLENVNLNVVGKIPKGTGLYQRLESLGGKSLWESGFTTEWELSKILNNSKLLNNTEFHKMGVKVPQNTVKKATE